MINNFYSSLSLTNTGAILHNTFLCKTMTIFNMTMYNGEVTQWNEEVNTQQAF